MGPILQVHSHTEPVRSSRIRLLLPLSATRDTRVVCGDARGARPVEAHPRDGGNSPLPRRSHAFPVGVHHARPASVSRPRRTVRRSGHHFRPAGPTTRSAATATARHGGQEMVQALFPLLRSAGDRGCSDSLPRRPPDARVRVRRSAKPPNPSVASSPTACGPTRCRTCEPQSGSIATGVTLRSNARSAAEDK